MQTRFVVIPAVPLKKEIYPRPLGFPAEWVAGYDIYDTQEKLRLSLNFPTRAEAEYQCASRNNCGDAGEAGMAGNG